MIGTLGHSERQGFIGVPNFSSICRYPSLSYLRLLWLPSFCFIYTTPFSVLLYLFTIYDVLLSVVTLVPD